MKRVFLSGAAICLLASSGLAIAFGNRALQRTAIAQDPAQPEQDASAPEPQLEAAREAVSAEPIKEPITKVYPHKLNGRSAATVHVRNIPVATFFGDETNSSEEPSAASQSAMDRAEAFAANVERLNTADNSGDTVGVKWDSESNQFVIHVGEENLIAMTETVILPNTTDDKAEDALQITNRLRRQLSQAEPLKDIANRPRPVVAKKPEPPTAPAVRSTLFQEGWASWYGPGFHGNLTASGGRFNQYAMTAAHRSLPFGSRVKVTNLNSGRSVVVTINDRGPFIHNRVIDLSRGAAEAIGAVSSGVAPVRLDLLQ